MPDVEQPGSRWLLAAHAVATAGGLVGILGTVSPSVLETLSSVGASWAAPLWSATYMTAGAAALVSRRRRRYFAETVAVDVMGGVLLLWALMVTVANGAASDTLQAACAFLGCGLFVHGWAVYRRSRLNRNAAAMSVARAEGRSAAAEEATAVAEPQRRREDDR